MYWFSPVALRVTRVGRGRALCHLPPCLAPLRGQGASWAAGQRRSAGSVPRQGPGEGAFRCFKLPHRGLVRMDGKDSVEFLQGLTTGDVKLLMETDGKGGGGGGGVGVYGHFLNVQGRVLYDVLFYRIQIPTQPDPSILLECDLSIAPDLQKHLGIYKIRRKVSIHDPVPRLHVWAILPPEGTKPPQPPPPQLEGRLTVDGSKVVAACGDPRTEAMGWRMVLDEAFAPTELLPDCEVGEVTDYDRHRYRIGIAEGVKDLPPGVALPLESNLVFSHGVSFSKGCYLGQELTARTHHTGVIRKRIMPVQLLDLPEGARVAEGSPITSGDGRRVGKMRSHDGHLGLALVRLAHAGETLHVRAEDGRALALKASVPDWWPKDGGGGSGGSGGGDESK